MTSATAIDRTNGLLAAGGDFYAARQTGLYRVDGAGRDSQDLYRSWLPDQDVPTLAIETVDSLLLAGINGGVARSKDGGRSWNAHQFRFPAPLVTCLAISPGFSSDGLVLAGTFEDGVFRSTDGGESWGAVSHGLFDHSIYALVLSPGFADDGLVYLGTGSGLYKSENGGRLWWDMTMPSGDETVLSLALSVGGVLYAGSESHGLLRTSDGGANWETILETEGAVNAVALAGDGTLIAQVDDRVCQATDGGANWVEVVAADVDCIALDSGGKTLYLAMADGSIHQQSI